MCRPPAVDGPPSSSNWDGRETVNLRSDTAAAPAARACVHFCVDARLAAQREGQIEREEVIAMLPFIEQGKTERRRYRTHPEKGRNQRGTKAKMRTREEMTENWSQGPAVGKDGGAEIEEEHVASEVRRRSESTDLDLSIPRLQDGKKRQLAILSG
jgi:hypothetical protein